MHFKKNYIEKQRNFQWQYTKMNNCDGKLRVVFKIQINFQRPITMRKNSISIFVLFFPVAAE